MNFDGELMFSAIVSNSFRFIVFFKTVMNIYHMSNAILKAEVQFDLSAVGLGKAPHQTKMIRHAVMCLAFWEKTMKQKSSGSSVNNSRFKS